MTHWIAIASCLLLASCAPQKSIVGTRFDGTYDGTKSLITTNNPGCLSTTPALMVITDGILDYHHFGNWATFELAVDEDGSFYGTIINMSNKQPQVLKGKIFDDKIEADTSNPYCKYHLSLERK
jgi:hypothetical protein